MGLSEEESRRLGPHECRGLMCIGCEVWRCMELGGEGCMSLGVEEGKG